MNKVMAGSTAITVGIYGLIAVFGYLSWVGTDQEKVIKNAANILEVDYRGNLPFTIALLLMIFSTFCASPVCILPAKDAFEQIFWVPK